MLVGIFSTKEIMKYVVQQIIEDEMEDKEVGGDFHFKYLEMELDQPWLSDSNPNAKAIFSFSTMHDEYFPNKIETDWKTGKITNI